MRRPASPNILSLVDTKVVIACLRLSLDDCRNPSIHPDSSYSEYRCLWPTKPTALLPQSPRITDVKCGIDVLLPAFGMWVQEEKGS